MLPFSKDRFFVLFSVYAQREEKNISFLILTQANATYKQDTLINYI